jgi:hypothetical protein
MSSNIEMNSTGSGDDAHAKAVTPSKGVESAPSGRSAVTSAPSTSCHTALLPCPFCGDTHLGTMEMTSFDETPARQWKRVKCDTCGAMAPAATWNSRANRSEREVTP